MNSVGGNGGAVIGHGGRSPQSGVVTPLKSGRFSLISHHAQAGISPQTEPEAAGTLPVRRQLTLVLVKKGNESPLSDILPNQRAAELSNAMTRRGYAQ